MSKKINFKNIEAVAKKNEKAAAERERKYLQDRRKKAEEQRSQTPKIDPFIAFLIAGSIMRNK